MGSTPYARYLSTLDYAGLIAEFGRHAAALEAIAAEQRAMIAAPLVDLTCPNPYGVGGPDSLPVVPSGLTRPQARVL